MSEKKLSWLECSIILSPQTKAIYRRRKNIIMPSSNRAEKEEEKHENCHHKHCGKNGIDETWHHSQISDKQWKWISYMWKLLSYYLVLHSNRHGPHKHAFFCCFKHNLQTFTNYEKMVNGLLLKTDWNFLNSHLEQVWGVWG